MASSWAGWASWPTHGSIKSILSFLYYFSWSGVVLCQKLKIGFTRFKKQYVLDEFLNPIF